MTRINKLFQRLTLLDILFFIIALSAVLFVLVGYSREKRWVYISMISTTQDKREFSNYPFSIIPSFVWQCDSINVGDISFNSLGLQTLEVVDKEDVNWGGQRKSCNITLKVNSIYDKKTGQYRIGDRLLQTGNYFSFDIGKVTYLGIITYIGNTGTDPESKYGYLTFELKSKGVDPWSAKTYTSSFLVKNSKSEIVFKIIESKEQLAEVSSRTAQGNVVASYDPRLRDVYISAIAKVRCKAGSCFFMDTIPIKVGSPFWIESNDSFLDPSFTTIISVGELTDSVEAK